MKKSVLFTILTLTMGLAHAVEPFIGVYGVTDAENTAVDYVGNSSGITFGVEGEHLAVEGFSDLANNGRSGMDVRFLAPIGSFTYSLGIGVINEKANIVDTSGNWDNTSSGPKGNNALLGVIQIQHKSGLYLRYTRHDYNYTYTFRETAIVGGKPTTLDSKNVTVDEGRNLYMLGYNINF